MWRKYDAISLATPQAFRKDPAKVWQFYHYRREKWVLFPLSRAVASEILYKNAPMMLIYVGLYPYHRIPPITLLQCCRSQLSDR